jgi:hypothetical protein
MQSFPFESVHFGTPSGVMSKQAVVVVEVSVEVGATTSKFIPPPHVQQASLAVLSNLSNAGLVPLSLHRSYCA